MFYLLMFCEVMFNEVFGYAFFQCTRIGLRSVASAIMRFALFFSAMYFAVLFFALNAHRLRELQCAVL